MIGVLLAIGAAIAWGLEYTCEQKILERWKPSQVITVSYGIGFLISLPFSLSGTSKITALFQGRDIFLIGAILLLSLAADVLILTAISKIGASRASVFEIAYPFFIMLFAAMFFHERLPLVFYLGGSFITCGATLIAAHWK